MRHVIAHALDNHPNGVTTVATACLLQLDVEGNAAPGNFVDDAESAAVRWCPRCLATVQGREADQGLHPDVGLTEPDPELGALEDDGSLGELEVEDGGDPFMEGDGERR